MTIEQPVKQHQHTEGHEGIMIDSGSPTLQHEPSQYIYDDEQYGRDKAGAPQHHKIVQVYLLLMLVVKVSPPAQGSPDM